MGAYLFIYGRYGTKLALTSAPMTSARMTSGLMASGPRPLNFCRGQTCPAPCLAGELPVAMEIICSDKNYR